jgi:protein-tyrosine phosphatase
MIDLHAHILPGIDDGPRNLEGSVALARAAVAEGTRVLAATSHIDHSFGLTPADLAPAVDAVRARLAEEGIPLQVVAGGEISIARLPELHDEDLLALRLGGGPTLLVEAPLMPFAGDLEGLVFALQVRRHRVLLAHPERSPMFLRRPERLATLVNQGVLVQITAGSLLGDFGEPVRRFTIRLLADGLAHVIASDAHDDVRRPPGVRDAFAIAESDLPGAGLLESWMSEEVPAAVLEGGPMPERPELPPAPGRRLRRLIRRA